MIIASDELNMCHSYSFDCMSFSFFSGHFQPDGDNQNLHNENQERLPSITTLMGTGLDKPLPLCASSQVSIIIVTVPSIYLILDPGHPFNQLQKEFFLCFLLWFSPLFIKIYDICTWHSAFQEQ